MASEVIKLNLIPKGEMPVFHASQFDTGRLITCELYRGEDAYDVPAGYTVELHCRKVDNNIVTMASTSITNNVVTFTSTEQLTACNGKNLCEVAILDEDYRIGTLNFILEVEIDPLKGGITSTSEIHNLETQIEEITTEVIGENYYNKTEVDELLDTKADASSVYTKSETDTKLALKANAADVYTKSQTDTLLDAKASITYVDGEISSIDSVLVSMQTDIDRKADASDVYTKAQVDSALALKANAADVYTKEQTYTQAEVDALIDNIFPTLTATGPIASFTTALTKPLVSVTVDEGATTVTRCGVNLFKNTFNNAMINQISYTKNSDGSMSVSGTATGGFAQAQTTVFLKAGNYIISDNCTFPRNSGLEFYCNATPSATTKYNDNVNFTVTQDGIYNVYIFVANGVSIDTTIYPMIRRASVSDTTYNAYTGNTVPVADATTLTTLSGVNNVYADVGEVTVQYKYMSI